MVGRAFDATVKITDYAEASIGTALGPRLMEAARRAAVEAARAAVGPVSNEELEACLVAVLCAHAALEGTMNEVGDMTDAAWWATQERLRPFESKWAALVAKRSKAAAPSKGDSAWDAVCRLTWDRNRSRTSEVCARPTVLSRHQARQ